MSPSERRRQLHGWVTVEALDGWQQFADRNGTNVTALMEALGRHLAVFESTPLPKEWRQVVGEAQRIAGNRSSRVGRRPASTDTESDL